jgi:hypothetical protein
MKIKERCIIVSVIGLILLFVHGMVSAQLSAQKLQKVTQTDAVDTVYFSKTPQIAQLQLPPKFRTTPSLR